jgi:hypothetical protein
MKHFIPIIICVLLIPLCACKEKILYIYDNTPAIIPKPLDCKVSDEFFKLTGKTIIVTDIRNEELNRIGSKLAKEIEEKTGISAEIEHIQKKVRGRNKIFISPVDTVSSLDEEGYRLKVTKNRIMVESLKQA